MSRNRKFPRYVKLELVHLEDREAPSVTPWTTLSFDGSTVGSAQPLSWSQGSNDPLTSFSITNSSTAPPSGANDFSVSSGTSELAGAITRAWDDQTMPADVQVSAALYVTSLIPVQVFARGSNIDPTNGDEANFYAVQLSLDDPGPLLVLVKYVDGTKTTLASINAPNYVQDQ